MKNKIIVLIGVISVVLFLAAILAFVTSVISNGAKEPVVSVAGGEVIIDAQFGVTFPVDEIVEYELIDKSMDEIGVGRRTNGYGGVGATLRGHFESEAFGKHLLYVESDATPTLYIDRAGDAEDVFLSFSDGAKTLAVFDALATAVPKG